MSGNDVRDIRDDLGEVRRTQADIIKAVSDLRVLVAGNYVPRVEFDECQRCAEIRTVALHKRIDDHKKDDRENMYKLAGLVFAVSSLVFGALQWAVSLASK